MREGHRKAAGGIDGARHDVGEGCSATLTRILGLQHRRHAGQSWHQHRPTRFESEQQFPTSSRHGIDQRVLIVRQRQRLGAGKVTLLSEVLVAGVIIATLANIAGGMASDGSRARGGTRLPWLWVGMIRRYVAIAVAHAPRALILGVVLFQLAFNILYGPLGTLLADTVPDRLKGRMSVYIHLAFPLASLVTAAVGSAFFTDDMSRMWAIAAIAACLIVPLLSTVPTIGPETDDGKEIMPGKMEAGPAPARAWQCFLNLWIARFLMQRSGTVVLSYFLFYLQQKLGDGDMRVVQSAFANPYGGNGADGHPVDKPRPNFGSVRTTQAIHDRHDRADGCGILLLAFGQGAVPALAGYVSFSMGLGAFLTIDLALVAQMLTRRSIGAAIWTS